MKPQAILIRIPQKTINTRPDQRHTLYLVAHGNKIWMPKHNRIVTAQWYIQGIPLQLSTICNVSLLSQR